MAEAAKEVRIVPVAKNRRASFDYELTDHFEAGMVLMGSEVKMLRNGKADLTDTWCVVLRGEAFINGLNIPVDPSLAFPHEPKRSRKLLLHEREIASLKRGIERDGMTVTATKLYFKNGRAKVEIALARGKKKGDKRQALKSKDAEREARQAMVRGRRGD